MRKGLRAARQNLRAMLALQMLMAAIVAAYYCWPAATMLLSRYAVWQHSGGVLGAAFATAVAGGVLSEASLVYIQNGGRWTAAHVENLCFKFVFFFFNGALVYEFYILQSVWFGNGTAWSILLPKILVDQFGFTVFWSLPVQSLLFRWQLLCYSWKRLGAELDVDFVLHQMLPVLITNWMFWIPGVSLIYSLPQILQTPLFIFAIAIWGILLSAVTKQGRGPAMPAEPVPVTAPILLGPAE
jgi:hypothetical protein